MSKEKLNQLEKEFNRLQEELAILKEKANEKKLYLEVDSYNHMWIKYESNPLGLISKDGECYILSGSQNISVYEKWREDGMIIDSSTIEWRGGQYLINKDESGLVSLKREDIKSGSIYNFELCEYMIDCEDDNIITHKHNKKPVGF